jgi:hypothetical protein
VERRSSELLEKSALIRFNGDAGKDPIVLDAVSGWLARVGPGKVEATGLRFATTLVNANDPEGWLELRVRDANDLRSPTLDDLQFDDDRFAGAAKAALAPGGNKVAPLDDVAVAPKPAANGSRTFEITRSDGSLVTGETDGIEGKHARVREGTIELSTTRAVETMLAAARGPAETKPAAASAPVFFRFGPEGIETTRSDQEQFVVFMSSNPSDLTQRVKTFVNARETQEALVGLTVGPAIAREKVKVERATEDKSQAQALAQRMATVVNASTWDGTSDTTFRATVLQWLSSVEAQR